LYSEMSEKKNPEIREIYKEVVVRGPKGEARTYALIDTGATISLFTRNVLEKTGLYDEAPADVCGINTCVSTRSGYVDIEIPGTKCKVDRALAMELDFNLVGMDPMSDQGAIINTRTGEVYCYGVSKFLGLDKLKRSKEKK